MKLADGQLVILMKKNFIFVEENHWKNFLIVNFMSCTHFQPKNAKEEDIVTEEDVPKFIEKKIKSA